MNQNDNNATIAAVSAIATASKTPFKTAFKVMMGIAMAQLLIGLLFLGGCTAIVGGATLLLKK